MKGFRHAGIVVKDLAKALHFYRDLLGFKQIKKKVEKGNCIDAVCGGKDISVITVKLSADDHNLIELLHFISPATKNKPAKGLSDTGFSHISCTVENIDALYRRLSKAGIRFNCPPQISSDGLVKLAFCRDPEGNFIELVEVLEDR